MPDPEYLLSYGLLGDFGRFRTVRPLSCRRGDRVVAQSGRGLEIAEVLRAAAPGHALFLPNTSVGQLVRLSTPEDEMLHRRMRDRAQQLLGRGQDLAGALHLPLALLDAEVLLDGAKGVLHHLRGGDCDVRTFVSTLAREFALQIELLDVGHPPIPPDDDADHTGCGREGCGGGNCGSCGSGGGCSTCGSAQPDDVRTHFAELRQKMEQRHALI